MLSIFLMRHKRLLTVCLAVAEVDQEQDTLPLEDIVHMLAAAHTAKAAAGHIQFGC